MVVFGAIITLVLVLLVLGALNEMEWGEAVTAVVCFGGSLVVVAMKVLGVW